MPVPDAIRAVVEHDDLSLPLLVRAGSKAYGIDVEGSDDDYVGVFIPRLPRFLSIHGIAHDTYARNDPDFTIHEIGKFCHLALKGNPAILEMLWNPELLECDAWGRELLALRDRMLHRGSLEVYVAYAEAQMKKMVSGKGLHAKSGTYNGKYGAHLVRLLHAGIGLAAAREVMVRVPPALAATLLSIRKAERSMEQVLELARPLLERLKRLSETNTLPEKADVEAVNDLVVRARLSRT